jgi:hypothetical protein
MSLTADHSRINVLPPERRNSVSMPWHGAKMLQSRSAPRALQSPRSKALKSPEGPEPEGQLYKAIDYRLAFQQTAWWIAMEPRAGREARRTNKMELGLGGLGLGGTPIAV